MKQKAILCVWDVSKTQMHYGFLIKGTYHDFISIYSELDQELLRIFQKHSRYVASLYAIAVAPHSLGGFASSRLALASLNVTAWLKNIPIIALPRDLTPESGSLAAILARTLRRRHAFNAGVMPVYQRPPDITQSVKKKKFTIE